MKFLHRNIDYRKDLINPPGDYFSETILWLGPARRGLF